MNVEQVGQQTPEPSVSRRFGSEGVSTIADVTVAPLFSADELTIRLVDRPLRVRSEVPGLLRWLREAFVPSCDEVDSVAGIELVVRSTPYRGTVPRRELIPCYALGERVVPLAGTRTGATAVVVDDRFGVRIAVGPGRVELQPCSTSYRLGPVAFRVARELVLGPLAHAALHAAAFSLAGRVVALAGPKKSGKTTLLTRVTTASSAGFVANDSLLVLRDGVGFSARGIPTLVRVREQTAALLAPVLGHAFEAKDGRESSNAELTAAVRRSFDGTPRRHGMSPAEFAAALGVPREAGGSLEAIALVSVDPAAETFTFERLGGDELEERLTGCFRHSGSNRQPTVFDRCLGYDSAPDPDSNLARDLVRNVPIVGLRVGPALLTNDESVETLLDSLRDLARLS
jgi:hypothetical protein